jgi:micrococcal nuclease
MHTKPTTIITCVFLNLIGSCFLRITAHAERLSPSDSQSTIQPQCDLCWTPSSSDRGVDRLPTFKPHRPPHPPDSRPHRLPKGRYKLTPSPKHSHLSTLRALSKKNARLASNQQIVALDGDTLRIGADRIRLRGIDAPELTQPGGQAAKQRLEQLLQEGPIRIVPHGQDVYGRTIADVFVNGQNAAEILKSEGFAKTG